MLTKTRVKVIGAGIVGLSIARQLRNAVVIEKAAMFGWETSSRNSQVIHAGLFYPAKSLKTLLCIEGKQLLYQLCQREKIPFRRTGKFIVAQNAEEENFIMKLHRKAKDLDIISEIISDKSRLPAGISAKSALWSESTGIVDSHKLMSFLEWEAMERGCMFEYNTQIVGIQRHGTGYLLLVRNLNSKQEYCIQADLVINASGLDASKTARLLDPSFPIETHFFKGHYFRVNRRNHGIGSLVYPVPEQSHGEKGLGIHLTLDFDDSLRFGPDNVQVPQIDYDIKYTESQEYKQKFYAAIKRYFPSIRFEELRPDYAGIRPKLSGKGEFRDFYVSKDDVGFVNLVGIESPGLTASLAIGRYVVNQILGSGK